MASSNLRIFYSFLILFSHISHTMSIFTYGFRVHVINGLPNPMTVHCASRNNDFGMKQVAVNEDFHWSFHRNFLLNTLYFCHFWWSSYNRSFDVFNYTISEDCRFDKLKIDGNECVWVVKEDGFYFGNQLPPQNLEKIHVW